MDCSSTTNLYIEATVECLDHISLPKLPSEPLFASASLSVRAALIIEKEPVFLPESSFPIPYLSDLLFTAVAICFNVVDCR